MKSELVRVRRSDKIKIDQFSTMFDLNLPKTFHIMANTMPQIIKIEKQRLPKSKKKKWVIDYRQEFLE